MDLLLRLNEPSYLLYLDSVPGFEASVSMHHPADQAIRLAVSQRPRIMRYPAIGNRRMQQRTYFAMKFGLDRRTKIRKPRTQTVDAHRTDALTPGLLLLRGHGINLIQPHLWSDVAAVRRKFRAAVTA